MLAHLHLSLARTAPKTALPYASKLSPSRLDADRTDIVVAEYDKVSPSTKTKEHHYTEAAANLNRADAALQASGDLPENEPSSMAMGKSELLFHLRRAGR